MVLALLVSLPTPLHFSWWSLSAACVASNITKGCQLRFARIDRPQGEPLGKTNTSALVASLHDRLTHGVAPGLNSGYQDGMCLFIYLQQK
jgi:hypothetical protein